MNEVDPIEDEQFVVYFLDFKAVKYLQLNTSITVNKNVRYF